ncbi:MAG: MBL fold metallo-hydrolase, partial [Gaiellaceae bacterium]
PPDIDVEAWERTLDAIEARSPARLCLPHFGVVVEPEAHLAEMRERLRTWAGRVGDGASEEEFVRAAEEELRESTDADTADAYRQAGPFWQSYAGLRRYWDKRGETAAA